MLSPKPARSDALELIATEADVIPTVLAAMADTPDPRLKDVMNHLILHLHRFICEVRPTEAEFELALQWITALGHHTHASHNEVVLAADVLGASTLIDLINNNGLQGETMSALLGPFYRGNAPLCHDGASIARSRTQGAPLFFQGKVTGTDGTPIAGARADIWQASPVGLYENQDETQEDFNLRGVFLTSADGRFNFTSIRPSGYPVPTDGPVGDLLRAQHRKPMRPAHIHFIISAPGHKTLITQIFADTAEALAADVVFGAKRQIVGEFIEHLEPDPGYPEASLPFFTCDYDFVLVAGESRFPAPPIQGKRG